MKKRTNGYTIILGIAFFVIIVYNIFLFNNTVNYEFEKSARNTLIDMADQQQLALNRQLETMIYNLINLSETLTIMQEDTSNDHDIIAYVNSKKDSLDFETAIIANVNGQAITSETDAIDISQKDYFKISINGETFATNVHDSQYVDKQVITVSAPMYVDGAITGVLALEYCTDYLGSLLTQFTNSKGISLVVNANSEIMISTNAFVLSFDAFEQAEFDDGMTFEKVKEDFKSGNSGSISYKLNGEKKLGEYRPIIINDWILFFEISEESMAESATNISSRMLTISIIIIAFSFAIILIVLFSRKNYLKDLEQIAYYDELTGGPNLLKFKMHVEQTMNNNPNGKYTMVKMDVANFKAINEVYGFETANKVLRAIAETSKKVSEKTFMQARVHADEFLLFSGGNDLIELEHRKDSYEAHFKTLVPELKEHNFYFRYGRYFINRKDKDVNEIINKTNLAHKFAKTQGMVNLCDYDDGFNKKILKNADIENKMHKALANGEFKVYLQPKFNIITQKMVGAEALVRWAPKDGSIMYPGEFIQLFEENGFIIDLDKYMLDSICKVMKEWKEKGLKIMPVSVNFSRLHMHNLNFVNELKQIVLAHGVEPSFIEIELTETTVLENESELMRVLGELREVGFKVSIDDFGSGYSSLGMLKNFKVNTLKLDRSFFIKSNDDEAFNRGNHVVKSIIELATALNMNIVAEGIENENQIAFLKSVNCTVAQGYYYSRPIPHAEFEANFLKLKQ